MAEDLTQHERIQTSNDLMQAVEREIAAMKSGEIKEGVGRLIFRGRTIQMKALELEVQASRQDNKLRAGLHRRFGTLIDVTPIRPAIAGPNGEPSTEAKAEADKAPAEGT